MKKLLAVLGDPIGHSMSPFMHNDLLAYYNIGATYLPFQVKSTDLKEAVRGLKVIGIKGFNVTLPHKSAIIPLLDGVDDLAASIGAVNTVVNEAGKLIGYNTDGPGFIKGLDAYVPSFEGQKILIIGAGGASRAIYFSMAEKRPQAVDIANRTIEKAVSLINDCPFPVSSKAISIDEANKNLGYYDIVVQTTSIGMYPKIEEQPVETLNLKEQALVCDIIYNPLNTMLLQKAKQKGARTQNGIDMFVYQGALAFEKWTGIFPNIERMKDNVLRQLGGAKNVDR